MAGGIGPDDHPRRVWTRWDREGEGEHEGEGGLPISDLHLHRYSAVWPLDDFFEPEARHTGSETQITFLSGPFRWGLRHTPLLVAFWAVAFVVAAELSPRVGGVGAYLATIPVEFFAAAGGAALVWGIILWLAIDADLLDMGDLVRGVVVYGLLTVLAIGTVVSVWLVFRAENPQEIDPHIVFTSGYLLTLLVGGIFLYETLLRVENLFEDLDEKLIVPDEAIEFDDGATIVQDLADGTEIKTREDAYRAFKENLRDDLGDRLTIPVIGRTLPIPTAYVFAPLFVSQFAAAWWVQAGPQNLDFAVTWLGNVFLDLFLVGATFQFLVLIKNFHELVTDSFTLRVETDDGVEERPVDILDYRPFHPDGRGGFRDFGRFATHFNLLLIWGGLYAVYRLYVQGARALPAAGLAGLDITPSLALAIWVLSYVGPLIGLSVGAGAWLYYSFWHLHLKMARERERQYTERLVERRANGETATPLGGHPEDSAQWQDFRNAAPVWPVNSRQLTSLVSGTLAPLLLSLPNFF